MVETRSGTATQRQSPVKHQRPHRSPPRFRPGATHTNNGLAPPPPTAAIDCTDGIVLLFALMLLYVMYTLVIPDPVTFETVAPTSATGMVSGFLKSLRFRPLWPLT